MTTATRSAAAIDDVAVAAYEIPVDGPDGKESDGTLEWTSTTLVTAEVTAGGETGLGFTYGHAAVGEVVRGKLAEIVRGRDAFAIGEAWLAMTQAIRNAGRPGVGFMAVSAVDIALWDLKARLLGIALVDLLDRCHDATPIYGSGGFCNYPLARLQEQLGGWAQEGIGRVKLKVSRHPDQDPERLDAVREAIGDDVELYVDANGALTRKQALLWAERFAARWGVSWFEEPVSSADLEGLRLLRDRGPGGLDIAAGEYAFVPRDFLNLVAAGAVDCLQADVTRCGGITGFLKAAGLADAHALDISGHCAPNLTAQAMMGCGRIRHLEYFHDHVRIERMLFDGVLDPEGGALRPDRSRPGHGLELKRADAARYAV
jgi:L-alanine-DL-glutamate epimerase-like enolase superfamily enzyme